MHGQHVGEGGGVGGFERQRDTQAGFEEHRHVGQRPAGESPRAVRDGLRERLLGTTEVANRVSSGLVQGMDSARQPTRTGAFVNCPVVAVR